MAYPQVISEFKRTRVAHMSLQGQAYGAETAAVGVKVHLDTTPALNGVEYPGYSETVRSWKKEDGTSPIIEWRWGSGDTEFSNSGKDPFHLGSYEDDGGCTPALRLTEQIGPGANEVWAYPYVRAEYNGGVAVEGKRVTFKCD